MRRRRTAATIAAVLLLAGCSGGGGSPDGGNADQAFVAPDGTIRIIPEDERTEPVRVVADTLDGERLDLASWRGNPVVVNVWASWCAPCRKEAPELKKAAAELAAADVRFVGVNTSDQTAQALAFERSSPTGYPSLRDEGRLLLAFQGAAPPNAVPTTLVLDEQGRIAARISAGVTATMVRDVVEDATGVKVAGG